MFDVEYTPSTPPDTPCKLIIEKDVYDVTVVSYTEDSIQIISKEKLPSSIGKARIDTGIVILIELLINRIQKNANKENFAGERLLSRVDNNLEQAFSIINPDINIKFDNELSKEQQKAVNSALKNDITYIWGPPGTGKSKVIGRIILELFKHNRTVLMTSHTNVAVDGAIDKSFYELDEYNPFLTLYDRPFPILRLGVATDLSSKASKFVTKDKHLEKLGKNLVNEKNKISNDLSDEKRRYSLLDNTPVYRF